MKNQQEIFQFHLSFKGDLVENSVDAFDVANTIMATGNIFQELSDIYFGEDTTKNIKININAFEKGSLITDFVILSKDLVAATLPLIPKGVAAYKVGKELLDAYIKWIELKKLLKGEKPEKARVLANSTIELKISGGTVNITMNDYRALQNKNLTNYYGKSFQPLKEDSPLKEMEVYGEDAEQHVTISPEDVPYLTSEVEIQEIDKVKYKGVISKIDAKICSGFLDYGKKRLSFYYSNRLSIREFDLLIESLHRKIEIVLVGTVMMDLENNPIKMNVNEVQSDLTLLSDERTA